MSDFPYWTQALGWATLGGVIGWFACGTYREWRAGRKVEASKRSRFTHAIDRVLTSRAITVLVAVVSVAGLVILFHQQAAITACIVRTSDATTSQLNNNRDIAGQDRKVIDDLITAIPTLTSPTDFQTALDAYQTAREANDAARATQSPYPSLGDTCPGIGD